MTRHRPDSPDALRESVREGYTKVLEERQAEGADRAEEHGRRIGYSDADLAAVPEDANLGVGCGNPTAIDALRKGETVVDLGSGAGMDAFLAARQVGPDGLVIGVDMTDAMLERARENAVKAGIRNVEFRKGQIEALPLEDASVDVIISNCVINLSPEKDRVFSEAYRVLRPGGRLMVSDIVLERELPEVVLQSVEAYIGCVGGASQRPAYLAAVREAGFAEVKILSEAKFMAAIDLTDPRVGELIERLGLSLDEAREYADAVTSVSLFAQK